MQTGRDMIRRLGGLLALAAATCSAPSGEDSHPMTAAKAGTAAGGDPTVESVIPASAPQDTTLDVRVLGSGYDRGSTVELLLDGAPIGSVTTNGTRYKNGGELVANITIGADALVAAYDVLVTTSRGKKGIGIEKFEVQLKGKPPSCPDEIPLNVTGLTGALGSDGGDYSGKLVASNGNFYLDLRNLAPARTMLVTTSAGSGQQVTRTFTNSHESVCGLTAMEPESTGSGVLEIQWSTASNRWTLRYGSDCGSEFGNPVPGNRISTARSGDTWTLSGATGTGILCRGRLSGKANWTQAGTAGALTMLLQRSP